MKLFKYSMESRWIGEYVPAGYLLWQPLLFPAAIILVEYILLAILLWFIFSTICNSNAIFQEWE